MEPGPPRTSRPRQGPGLEGLRFALWKNAEDLTDRQAAKLTWIAATDPRLHRAWRLKEALRAVFALAKRRPRAALKALDTWTSWARRCRIPAFVDLQRKIVRHCEAIRSALITGLSNGLIESTNTKTRLIIRRGFGFHSADAVIALVSSLSPAPAPPSQDANPPQADPHIKQESRN